MQDQIKFKEYMAAICELHDKTMSRVMIDLYWKVLEPFSDEECEKAFKELILSNRFFPKPVDFMEIIQGKKENRATEAWLIALGTLKHYGNYESVKFADPVIHSVIEVMGGWPQFGTMTNDEIKWKQKEFERLYEVMSSREGKHPEYLPGIFELENTRNGWPMQNEVIRIGYEKLKLIAAR